MMPRLLATTMLLAASLMQLGASELTVENFDETIVNSKEVWLVRFTSDTKKPWAPVCKKLNDPWKEVADKMKKMKTVTIDLSDGEKIGVPTEWQKVAKRYGIMKEGLPNVKIFLRVGDDPETVLAAESVDTKKLRKRVAKWAKKLKKDDAGSFIKDSPKPSKALREENFAAERKALIAKEENQMFVKFYRPECNHCKALAPKWEEAAETLLELHSNIQLFEVNCKAQKNLCEKEGVSSHPTLIKYTKKNMEEGESKGFGGEVYHGKHEVEELMLFVEDPAAYKVKLDKALEEDKNKDKKGDKKDDKGASDEEDL
jgi:thiol-disulfide isomerase/thioredoxin